MDNKWHIIEYVPDVSSESIAWFDTEEEAGAELKDYRLENNDVTGYYDNLVEIGGSLFVQYQ